MGKEKIRLKNRSIKLLLIMAMTLIFLAYAVFVFNSPKAIRMEPLLALVGLSGVVLSIIMTYKSTNWTSFFFTGLPIYIFSLFSFVYSILGLDSYLKVAVVTLIIIYVIRLVKVGWNGNSI